MPKSKRKTKNAVYESFIGGRARKMNAKQRARRKAQGSGQCYRLRVGPRKTLPFFCPMCKGTVLAEGSVAESPAADRGARNASDRAPFSVGAAALKRRLQRRKREALLKHGEAFRLRGNRYLAAFYGGKVAELDELLFSLFPKPRKAPAENASNSPTPSQQPEH